MTRSVRTWFGVGAGLAVIGLLLGLPAPKRPAAGVRPAATAPVPGGPTLASVWPKARPFPIQALFPDGSAYTPAVVLGPDSSIGVTASADGQRTDLMEVPATGAPRVLQSQLVTDGGSFDGLSFTADRLYWMHTLSDTPGKAHVTLWTAASCLWSESVPSSGQSRQLSRDVGTPGFYGSSYDVQAARERLYWTGGRPGRQDQTELRSIPLTGGTVTVRVIPGAWAMSKWPWLVTAPSASDQPTRLQNLSTGQLVTVRVPANKQVTCSPTWCRMIPNNSAQATETDLVRLDGSDQRVIGDANAAAIASDVALLDRYEVLMTIVSTSGRVAVSKLTLYDIARRSAVLVDPAAASWPPARHEPAMGRAARQR